MKIAHDAGHGYNTAGKRVPDGSMREWEFNSVVASLVETALERFQGVQQIRLDDPTGRTDVGLKDRTDRANSWGANVIVSYHANAFGVSGFNSAHGIETYVHPNASSESKRLADVIQKNLVKETKRANRGVKSANFHMLRESKMTSVLLEMGFMTNREEAGLLKSTAYRILCAKAIVDSLVEVYKLKAKPAPKKTTVSASSKDTFFRVVVGSFNNRANAEIQQEALKRAGFDSFLDAFKK